MESVDSGRRTRAAGRRMVNPNHRNYIRRGFACLLGIMSRAKMAATIAARMCF
jgi:hypothetical protein